jgi:hypothetical protein
MIAIIVTMAGAAVSTSINVGKPRAGVMIDGNASASITIIAATNETASATSLA